MSIRDHISQRDIHSQKLEAIREESISGTVVVVFTVHKHLTQVGLMPVEIKGRLQQIKLFFQRNGRSSMTQPGKHARNCLERQTTESSIPLFEGSEL